MIHEGREFDRPLELSAEVAVVGSGAGGPVAAKELAERGPSVVLLEEVGYYTTKDYAGHNQCPEGIFEGGNETFHRCLLTGGQALFSGNDKTDKHHVETHNYAWYCTS